MYRWQIRPRYFKGPQSYTFRTSHDEVVKIVADRDGYFEIDSMPQGPLGVFARFLSAERTAVN